MSESWIVPFKGREDSGAFKQNFLWRDGPIYIMDNHRAAMWCWLQHIDQSKKYNIFHIDRHSDTLYSRIEEWKDNLPNLKDITIDEYLNKTYKSDHGIVPLFSWDNYLSLFLEIYSPIVDECYFATHKKGDPPKFQKIRDIDVWEIPNNLEFWISESKKKWIVNVDLDYFFYKQNESETIMVSDDYISSIFSAISNKIQDTSIIVLTLCLSPDCTGGWAASEKLCGTICEILNLNFHLPITS
jgi:hypothetical protein